MAKSILWYDLESFGTNPHIDRIAQFAAVRTNDEFVQVAEPIVEYCRITPDYVPDPLACLVTGISPQAANEKGLRESAFAGRIHELVAAAGTTIAGYNTVRFDDEFLRNLFYRNFFDPYEHEYARGNSRWDLIDLARAAHDLRPEGINWPEGESGKPSFRLEDLTRANGIEHGEAHEALADVRATIELARLIHDRQPKLFRYLYANRTKARASKLIDLHGKEPILHTSAMFTSERGCTTVVAPLTVDPGNNNVILAYDLRHDPSELLRLDVSGIKQRIFTPRAELDDSEPRIHIKGIHLNRSPVLAPLNTLDEASARRLGIDMTLCRKNLELLRGEPQLIQKLRAVYERDFPAPPKDPELQIYSGGFFPDRDRAKFDAVRSAPAEELRAEIFAFEDRRLPELLWRYRCRNYAESLSTEEAAAWRSFCAGRILFPPIEGVSDFAFASRKVREHAGRRDLAPRQKGVLRELSEYLEGIRAEILSF
jgi:exodeoxyribonuclease-1